VDNRFTVLLIFSHLEQKVKKRSLLPENKFKSKHLPPKGQPGPGRGKRKRKGTPQARGWITRKRRKSAETPIDSSPTFVIALLEAILKHSATKTRAQYVTQQKLQVCYENDSNNALDGDQGPPVLLGKVL
jgi:hypothetical protein